MSGARFNVISSRRSPLHKFVIQKITRPAPDAPSTAGRDSVSATQQPAIDTAPEPIALADPKGRGWLSRLTGRKVVSDPAIRPSSVSKDPQVVTSPPVAAHNIEEYNWSGFSCPYCGASSFVSCGGGHLACDGTATLRDGRRFHQCFCGQAGFISGSIKTVESKRLSVEADVGGRTEPAEPTKTERTRSEVALPRPTQSGPPAKR
jgi:hypothetical protein